MKILYFAWIKSKVGVGEEDVAPPASVTTVGALIDWLKERGPGYGAAFAELKVVRAAVNQEHVGLDHGIGPRDEIAFFPPVTGG